MKLSVALASTVRRYPALCVRDVFKFLYQGAFGCEHLLSSPEGAEEALGKEAAALKSGASR